MAQSSNNATVIVTSIVVALISFGGGYFVGSNNVSTAKGDAPASAAPGAGQTPTFGGAEGAANAGDAFKGTPSTLTDSPQIPVGNSPVLGNPNAPVTIIEFSDFQCPFCQRGADTLKQVQKKYPNDVRIVFKNFPLAFHKEAPAASKAALAAGQQGKYWEMHDKLFENFRNFKANAADMKGYTAGLAGQLGLDVEKFKADFDNPEFDKMIKADQALGSKLGVRGTPHFFINGVRMSGAQPLPKFEEVVKAQLAEAKKNGGKDVYKNAVAKNYKAAEPPQAKKPAASKVSFIPVNDADAMAGNTSDPLVTVVEFSDFQCPFCSRGADTVNEIKKNYGKDVRIVFKHLPLPFHKEAPAASQAALAAGKQGKFWEMHDLLFENQKAMKGNPELFNQLAEKLGLNMAKFKADFNDPAIAKQIKDDTELASRVGARGTPNFFVNGIQVVGAQPFPAFKGHIDKQIELAKKFKKEKGLKGDALYKALVEENKKNAPKAAPTPSQPSPKVDTKLLVEGKSFSKGPKNAPITIYEFSDFQCPFCSRGANTVDEVFAKYPGKVRVVFKAYPLPFHKEAEPAHRAAIAAGRQGKFFEMHDILFKNQKAFKSGDINALMKGYAQEIGLNMAQFEKDYNDPAVAKQVKDEMAEGAKVGVRGTPNFFVNGNRLVGAQPLPKFEEIINAELKK